MGSCLSSSTKPRTAPNNVRIVHFDGLVEDYDHPVFVDQLITSKPPKHFICTPAQLLSPFSKPLALSAELEPGRLYFLLPFSTLQPDVSPVNLANLVKKLTEKASAPRPEPKIPGTTSPGASPMRSQARSVGSSVLMGSPSRSPTLFCQLEVSSMGYRSPRPVRAWRPLLDTIRERSFNRRSESDLQELAAELS